MAAFAVLILILLTSTLSSSSRSSSLDPKQLIALQSIGLPTKVDPCTTISNLTSCDSSSPFRHLISLTLTNCSSDIEFSSTALRSLSTLHSLSFLYCPLPLFKHPLPPSLSSSLSSFSSVSSLKHLSAVWLSRLKNLTHLHLVDVPVSGSGAFVFLSQMPLLQTLTVSNCNLSGRIPHRWHSFNLTYVDLSQNKLTGNVHSSINVLSDLLFLNLSGNSLSGLLPDSLGDLSSLKNVSFSTNSLSGSLPDSMKEMTDLVHLDLSGNQFNGSLPKFLAEMRSLKYLNLESNSFQGVLPYNASFVKRLDVFKVGGNSNLCYNHTLLSSKLKLGIAPCDKYGIPASPPPDKSDKSNEEGDGESEDDNVDDDDGGESKKRSEVHHGPNRFVLVVAIGLAVFVFFVIFCICMSKCCR